MLCRTTSTIVILPTKNLILFFLPLDILSSHYLAMIASRKFVATPIPEGGRIQESSDAVAAGLAPEFPTEISGLGNLTIFKARDAHYFAKGGRRDH
jgi:hypothetical protein